MLSTCRMRALQILSSISRKLVKDPAILPISAHFHNGCRSTSNAFSHKQGCEACLPAVCKASHVFCFMLMIKRSGASPLRDTTHTELVQSGAKARHTSIQYSSPVPGNESKAAAPYVQVGLLAFYLHACHETAATPGLIFAKDFCICFPLKSILLSGV